MPAAKKNTKTQTSGQTNAEAAALPPPLPPPLAPPPTPGELPHLGLVCRNCGCQHFLTVKTRWMNANKIRRTKACRYCGRRIHTEEKITKVLGD